MMSVRDFGEIHGMGIPCLIGEVYLFLVWTLDVYGKWPLVPDSGLPNPMEDPCGDALVSRVIHWSRAPPFPAC